MGVLKDGSKGNDVKKLQASLNEYAKPKPRLKLDGIFGPLTEAALREFQKKHRIRVTGTVNRQTEQKLCEADTAQTMAKIRLAYNVPKIAQPTNMSCWATAIAMMLSWKKSMSLNPKLIADELGYTQQFNSSGLHPEDTKVFKYWGLKWDAPMCYTVQGFADLLKALGPVWLAGNPKSPHVRVVIGISGDGTPDGTKLIINDPAGGRRYSEIFTKAMGKMESLGATRREMKMKKPIYVAHF